VQRESGAKKVDRVVSSVIAQAFVAQQAYLVKMRIGGSATEVTPRDLIPPISSLDRP
jgi:hypothetical protein